MGSLSILSRLNALVYDISDYRGSYSKLTLEKLQEYAV